MPSYFWGVGQKSIEENPYATGLGREFHSLGTYIYWAEYFNKKGDYESGLVLANLLEARADYSKADYDLALSAYRQQAERNDSRALTALTRMYKASATAGNAGAQVEAARLAGLIEAQRREAGKICTNPQTVNEIRTLANEEVQDPRLLLTAMLTGVLTGVAGKTGTPLVQSVTLRKDAFIGQSFTCDVGIIYAGTEFKILDSDFEYAGTDQYGNDLYYDKRLDNRLKEGAASIINQNAATPKSRKIDVQPLGNGSYRLTLESNVSGNSPAYSRVVKLN